MNAAGFGEDSYLPPVDDLTAPWWEATRERRLLLQRCARCGSAQWYPRPICTSCGSTAELGWVAATGRGSVDTFTVVARAPRSGLRIPYVVARVRLAEGPVMLSRIVEIDPGDVVCDAPVVVTWRELSDGRALPVFRADETPAHGGTEDGR